MRNVTLMKRYLVVVAICTFAAAHNVWAVTALQWLQAQTRPVFKPGHTLPHLGQMHCVNPPTDVRAELATNWGFNVHLNRPTGEADLIALAKSDPDKYKVAAKVANLGNMGDHSPELPDAEFQSIIDAAIDQIEGQVQDLNPDYIEHWAEYGLGVPAITESYRDDPEVVDAQGAMSWNEYISMRKGHYESLMYNAIKERWPNVFYTLYTSSGYEVPTDVDWTWDYKYMKNGTDLPGPEMYYNYFNTGYVGIRDMLSEITHARYKELTEN
jgi:hypothetical protein